MYQNSILYISPSEKMQAEKRLHQIGVTNLDQIRPS